MTILDDLTVRMARAVAEGDLETAAFLRDAIDRLRSGESNLQAQVPGRMGLGTSQETYARNAKPVLPTKPDPMTRNYKPGGRR